MKDELLVQFLIEGPELVQQGSDALLALESAPTDRALMDDAFRAVHTLKGSVGLFDLPAMATTLHAAEDVLGAVRSGVRAVDRPTVDSLLAVLTQTERWLGAIESAGGLPDDAVEAGRRLAEQLNTGAAAPADARTLEELPHWAAAMAQASGLAGPVTAIRYVPAEGCFYGGDDPVGVMKSIPGIARLRLGLRGDGADSGPYDPFACRLIIEALSTSSAAEVRAVLRFVPDQVEIVAVSASAPDVVTAVEEAEGQGTVRTLRVDAARLEGLAAMVDELVAARSALASLASLSNGGGEAAEVARGLAAQSEGLDRLVGRMHRQVMALRMTPVAPLLRRFPRVARELARSLGKEIDLVVQDNGVEADKAVIEGVFEPLTHLLRNAIDHGIESPEARQAVGKTRKGTIGLTAEATGGRFDLMLQDDGAGIDPDAIRAAVRSGGLLDDEAIDALSDAEAINLIFLPGFSTARQLSDVSGRGVGMDAVKAAVQRLGGRIVIDSAPGRGTTVTMTLPLSLTLTKIMVVTSAGEAYGVPMERVLETLRVTEASVTPIRAGQAFNWRNRTAPLLSLSSLVGGAASPVTGDSKVLVIRSGRGVVGVAVDSIRDRIDAAVRPLDGLLAGMPGISGATLLGDGQVLMVLDTEALVA